MRRSIPAVVAFSAALSVLAPGLAQTVNPDPTRPGASPGGADVVVLPTVVVTGARSETAPIDLPASIDVIDLAEQTQTQPGINVSEALGQVPGLIANTRQNYAQDLQISLRGFGSRASFGVRGVRLIQDGIPLTMPDGQGQPALFDLIDAQRIEVLKGPLAVLYGNGSGGVIELYSDLEPGRTEGSVRGWFGPDDSRRLSLQARGDAGAGVLALNASRFDTDGYRAHSQTRRETMNLRGRWQLDDDTQLTLVSNLLRQPETQDPLGLTPAQWAANPRAAGDNAVRFDTRKSVTHDQVGASLAVRLGGGNRVRLSAYGGRRDVLQYLAFAGDAPTASGGVVQLDRVFGGLGAQWQRDHHGAWGQWQWIAGVDLDRSQERRRGYVNELGVRGDLRRDEDTRATNRDVRVQLRWSPPAAQGSTAPSPWQWVGGLRHSQVRFAIDDAYITPDNPDDSGTRRFERTSAMLGVNRRLGAGLAAHLSLGRGFETPTVAEVAYRPDGVPGPNLALGASVHDTVELGLKGEHRIEAGSRHRWALSAFHTLVRDEIVGGPALQPGRNSFVNAGRTRRDGLELSWQARWSPRWDSSLAWTVLRARFGADTALGGEPAGGLRLAGTPRQTVRADLRWRPAPGWSLTAQWHAVSRIAADDRNTTFAPGYGSLGLRAGWLRPLDDRWMLDSFVRVDNLTDHRHVGSVIVNANGGRYFEPAPGRQFSVGVQLSRRFN